MEVFTQIKEDFSIFLALLKVVSPDCKFNLFLEFLFDSATLRRRYEEEIAFQINLQTGWR